MKQKSPNHIALTGDVINLGLRAEIRNARQWLEDFGSPEQVSVVCGNHDAYVPGSLEQAFEFWQPYLMGDDESRIGGARDYPALRRRGPISIVLCNSACVTPPFFATGCFDQHQMEGLAEILEQEGRQGQCRVVLIHHPPIAGSTGFQKRLIGGEYFREAVLKSGAEIVLHGHTHFDSLKMIEGRNGRVPVLGVPSAGQASGGKRPAARYNLLSIEETGEQSERNWSIRREQFGYGDEITGIRQIGQSNLVSDI